MQSQVIIVDRKESILSSFAKNIFSIIFLIIPFFINYYYLGNSTLIKWFVIILFTLWAYKKASQKTKTFNNRKEAIDHINSLYDSYKQ